MKGEGKALGAYRTIGEVSEWLGVGSHVLRSWERHFSELRKVKRVSGRRYYSEKDCEFLRYVHGKLSHEGYSLRGVKVLLKDGGEEEGVRGGDGVDLLLSKDIRDRILKLRKRLVLV
jgi:DNA-binding transcriptional MerR regulator